MSPMIGITISKQPTVFGLLGSASATANVYHDAVLCTLRLCCLSCGYIVCDVTKWQRQRADQRKGPRLVTRVVGMLIAAHASMTLLELIQAPCALMGITAGAWFAANGGFIGRLWLDLPLGIFGGAYLGMAIGLIIYMAADAVVGWAIYRQNKKSLPKARVHRDN